MFEYFLFASFEIIDNIICRVNDVHELSDSLLVDFHVHTNLSIFIEKRLLKIYGKWLIVLIKSKVPRSAVKRNNTVRCLHGKLLQYRRKWCRYLYPSTENVTSYFILDTLQAVTTKAIKLRINFICKTICYKSLKYRYWNCFKNTVGTELRGMLRTRAFLFVEVRHC